MAKLNKSKGEWAKELKKKNLEKRKRANMKKSVDRPQQKQKPKKKSKFTKIVPDTIKSIGKKIKSAISGSVKNENNIYNKTPWQETKAKAAEIKIKKKPLSPSQKKKDKAIMRAEDARRAKGKSLKRKQDSAAIMKAERASRAKSKKSIADKKAADNRDAKRGGFISANAMRSSAKKANKAQADRKKRKSDELVSRGRR
jgi:hypothetical protein